MEAPDPGHANLAAKVKVKEDEVRQVILNIERAIKNDRPEDKKWLNEVLQDLMPSGDNLVTTLVKLTNSRRYQAFFRLRIMVLRAVQMLLRIAVEFAQTSPQGMLHAGDPRVGMMCFRELVKGGGAYNTEPVIEQFVNNVMDAVFTPVPWEATDASALMPDGDSNGLLSCNALMVLAELGPEVLLKPDLPRRMLELFLELPSKADQLVEVALRMHAYGDTAYRGILLQAAVAHPGGKLLCEVLVQIVNRGDPHRKARATKVLTGCLAMPSSELLLYTNDARVLVEILLREIRDSTEDSGACIQYVMCMKVVITGCRAALADRKDELVEVIEQLRERETSSAELQSGCSELLVVVDHPPGQ